MKLSTFFSLSSIIATSSLVVAQAPQVPVPWLISDLSISNTRHGTGGFWSFNIVDTPTTTPQGFNTTCSYQSQTAYIFALDDPPYHAPCVDPSVTFGLYPNGERFVFNVTHKYSSASCPGGKKSCADHGKWIFSYDDVRGQEVDVQNNFGQAGYFSYGDINMYPNRSVPSTKCEFC